MGSLHYMPDVAGDPVRRQIELNARSGSGSRLLDNASFSELPELDTRLQRDLQNGSEHRLRATHNSLRREQPHSVNKPD